MIATRNNRIDDRSRLGSGFALSSAGFGLSGGNDRSGASIVFRGREGLI